MNTCEILVSLDEKERRRLDEVAAQLGLPAAEVIQMSVDLFLGHPDVPMKDGRPDWDRIIGDTAALSLAAEAMVSGMPGTAAGLPGGMDRDEADEGGATPAGC